MMWMAIGYVGCVVVVAWRLIREWERFHAMAAECNAREGLGLMSDGFFSGAIAACMLAFAPLTLARMARDAARRPGGEGGAE